MIDRFMGQQTKHFILGRAEGAHSRESISVVNPATEAPIASIPDGDEYDVALGVDAAKTAYRESGWPLMEPAERAGYLRSLADVLESRSQELGELVTAQIGMPLKDSLADNGAGIAKVYRYYAELAEQLQIETEVKGHGGRSIVRREPVGVAGLIVPWNGPQGAIAWKLAPALAAGCTTIIKPAPEASLDSYILAEALREAGIPPGVVNIVFGGGGTGQALASHPDVDKVSFTGSTIAGRKVAVACAERFARVTLELGGKSAAILIDDFDLDAFIPFVASACVPFGGQICHSLTRVLAPRRRYEEVVEAVSEAMSKLVVGDPLASSTTMGPLVSGRQRDRVERYLDIGRMEGAKIATGGGRPKGIDRGYYVEPTVFRDVTPSMTIAQEEIFGPVISVIPYEDEDDAVEICNGTKYGLSSAVFTSNTDLGVDLARRIHAGTVGVNHYSLHLDAPFGGVKGSGIGRELGREGLEAFLEPKSILHR